MLRRSVKESRMSGSSSTISTLFPRSSFSVCISQPSFEEFPHSFSCHVYPPYPSKRLTNWETTPLLGRLPRPSAPAFRALKIFLPLCISFFKEKNFPNARASGVGRNFEAGSKNLIAYPIVVLQPLLNALADLIGPVKFLPKILVPLLPSRSESLVEIITQFGKQQFPGRLLSHILRSAS